MEYISKTTRLAALLIVGVLISLNTNAQTFLTNGLIAYFPFNGNANDASGNAHNGTAFDTTLVQDQFGFSNSAFGFNEVSSYVEVMNYLPDMPSASFSVWVLSDHLPTAAEYYHEIFGDGDTTPDRDFRLEFQWNIGLSFFCKDNSTATIPLPLLRTNSWMNVIGVADATAGKMYLWLDGAPVATNSFTGNANVGYHYRFNIGRVSDGVHIGRYFAGRIDNLRIYNRALSSNEVAQLYAIESAPILNVRKAVYLDSSNLWVGSNYQVQVSSDLVNWTNFGTVFSATTNTWRTTNYWDVANWNQLFFRLQQQ